MPTPGFVELGALVRVGGAASGLSHGNIQAICQQPVTEMKTEEWHRWTGLSLALACQCSHAANIQRKKGTNLPARQRNKRAEYEVRAQA